MTAAVRIAIAIAGAAIVVNVIGNVRGIASRVRIAVVRAITTTTIDARNARAVGTVIVTAGVTAIVIHAPGAAAHVVVAAATAVAAAATTTIAAVADVVRAVVATIGVAVIAIMNRHNRIAAVGNEAVASVAVVNVPM